MNSKREHILKLKHYVIIRYNENYNIIMINDNHIPSITNSAFCCPHCQAFTSQTWYELHSKPMKGTPKVFSQQSLDNVKKLNNDDKSKKPLLEYISKLLEKEPFLLDHNDSVYSPSSLANCTISKCFVCKKLTIWVHEKIVYPNQKIDVKPNIDLPSHIKSLFVEASEVANISTKSAAALLRLCVQHLCIELGEDGKNINSNIAKLVEKGLDPLIQRSLDVIRVFGNESVHPATLNMNDTTEIVNDLFIIVNLICDQMISYPKKVNALYDSLPDSKLKGIEDRDSKS